MMNNSKKKWRSLRKRRKRKKIKKIRKRSRDRCKDNNRNDALQYIRRKMDVSEQEIKKEGTKM